MKKENNKQRLIEVMQRVDPAFKGKLLKEWNEEKQTMFKAVLGREIIQDTDVNNFINKMKVAGFEIQKIITANDIEVQSRNPIYDFSWKIGAPIFKGIIGPMRDGKYWRYETQEVYDRLST
jgi:hypothetical protein